MAATVYILGALTSLACAVLLLRGYMRGRKRLLLWSGLCFVILTLANSAVFIDLVMFPDLNFFRIRLILAVIAMAMLLYGLIWEDR